MARLPCPWDSPGKNTGVGCHGLLQGILLTQGSNLHLLCLLHWQAGSLQIGLPACVLSHFSHVRLFVTPRTVACQAPLSIGFSRQECWSGLPFPSPGVLPDPGIEPGSSALQADSSLLSPWGSPDSCWSSFQAAFTVPRSEDYLVLPQCRRKVVPITITRALAIWDNSVCCETMELITYPTSLTKKNRNVNISISCPQLLSLLKQLKTLC